ncbi:hypothetical protein TIFTF001_005779 [Ficus carica]|uniref:Uncharacterized protein n=1 Tax=Ficus carica TaxID=3494 RepID=A0AA87ZFU0_FICCA|nr:hypothetical protein TIFTF001_005779 [Ficus carica]
MDAICPTIQVMGGHECKSLVLVHTANTVSVRSGGGGWHRSRDKDKYSDSDKYQMSGVRWCKIVGVACLATIWLSSGMGGRGRGNIGQSSSKGT